MHMNDQNIEQASANNECHNDKYETFFDVVGVSRNESAHSNFLRWFFDQPEWNGKYLLQLFKICKDNANDQDIQIPDELRNIDLDKDDNNKFEIHSIELEKTCYVIYKSKPKWGKVDLVITSTLKNQNKVIPVKFVIENKINSPEKNNQTGRYYTYFSNSEYSGVHPFGRKGKRNRDRYKFNPDEYKGSLPKDTREEIFVYIYLHPYYNEPKDTICKHFIKITYQNLFDNIFSQFRQKDISKRYPERKISWIKDYITNMLQPCINNQPMCHPKNDNID